MAQIARRNRGTVQVPIVAEPVGVPIAVTALEFSDIETAFHIVPIYRKGDGELFHLFGRVRRNVPAVSLTFGAVDIVRDRIGILPVHRDFQIGIVTVVRLQAHTRPETFHPFGPAQRGKRIYAARERIVGTEQFFALVRFQRRIVFVRPHATL